MHWNKTFAGMFLIFSIANVVLAAPALIRQRHFVTERADEEPTGESKQDPAGLVHEEVEPAATPPPVGSQERWPTPAGSWTEEDMNGFANYLSNKYPNRPAALPNSPYRYGSSPYRYENSLDPYGTFESRYPYYGSSRYYPYGSSRYSSGGSRYSSGSSRYGYHPGSSLPEQDPGFDVHGFANYLRNLRRPALPGSPLHPVSSSPESVSGSPESLHTASHGQMLPPASSGAQPMHESDSDTDMSGLEEEGAKDAEELHPHI